jgi:hypothetical protein
MAQRTKLNRPYGRQHEDDVVRDITELYENSELGYKVYTALLSQSGTDAPTAVVLENTIGGTVTFSYNDVGNYYATLTGAFVNNKTFVIIGTAYELGGGYHNYANRDGNNDILIQSFQDTDAPTNNLLSKTAFEIRVYS